MGGHVMVRSVSTYQPIASVWHGSDSELLEAMLDFYPARRPKRILDATVNAGRFWKGSKRPVTGLDIDPRFDPDIVGDNRDMPFKAASFDVVVYDPPHVPNQGRDKTKDFNKRFGLVLKSTAVTGYNLNHLYAPFCREAYRVLRPEGILFCKIADYIHDHRYQWAHLELTQSAVGVGFCACDCIVKVRQSPIVDPKWKKAHHARRHHCYWLVFRKSRHCEK
jgi:SAM-dependent methyltransferase